MSELGRRLDEALDEVRLLRAENRILRVELEHLRGEVETPVLYDMAEAARILGCSATTVKKLMDAGRLGYIQAAGEGTRVKIRRDEIFDFLRRNEKNAKCEC